MSSSSIESTPALSVVVVAISPTAVLAQCLDVLLAETRGERVEILVVRDPSRKDRTPVDTRLDPFASVRWLDTPAGCTVPRMRSLAFHRCRADVVALIEDDCLVEPGWCAAILAAHRRNTIAVAGAVEPGPYRRAIDWGVYFCDYARFMLPLGAGAATALPGNNASFKRRALEDLPADIAQEFTEFQAHELWQRQSAPMRTDPSIRVRNIHSWTTADVTRSAYHHGRAFAGRRLAGVPRWRRLLFAAAAPLLPPLKTSRVVREPLARGRLVGRVLLALPWIVVFTTSWSIGEGLGALLGSSDSASAWR